MPSDFEQKKSKILEQLAIPDDEYTDLSPKGSVDENIQKLIADINDQDGLVTTSSCSGRISVFLEGKQRKKQSSNEDLDTEITKAPASSGGKGGGSWLFVSHEPVNSSPSTSTTPFLDLLGMKKSTDRAYTDLESLRFIHFKFEAMILHILTKSPVHAQHVLSAALGAGFRESGAVSLVSAGHSDACPIVAVRSAGLGFDSIVGCEDSDGYLLSLVEDSYLGLLVATANQRFNTNKQRIDRFHRSLLASEYFKCQQLEGPGRAGGDFEDPVARRARKKQEGLERQGLLSNRKVSNAAGNSASDCLDRDPTNSAGDDGDDGDDAFIIQT